MQGAKKIIIVPGYGMALAKAQQEVATLAQELTAMGKDVKYAIHPVAGRMPGHMNVLLAEAGIDYDMLVEMDVINPDFHATDLVIVVGACDVVNPAAIKVEGTPISGMPILMAHEAKKVICCNFDRKPGYSGVDNTLYDQENTIFLEGDAKKTIQLLQQYLAVETHPAQSPPPASDAALRGSGGTGRSKKRGYHSRLWHGPCQGPIQAGGVSGTARTKGCECQIRHPSGCRQNAGPYERAAG